MSSLQDIAAAIGHLQRAFMAAGLSTPVSIEVDPSTFRLLRKMAGKELVMRPVNELENRLTGATGNAYMMLHGQRIDECLF